MKLFDLSIPKPGEKSAKVYKILFEDFKKAWQDFPRPLAERLVELGYGKWASCNANGEIIAPQAMVFPEQIFFVGLRTGSVKAVHINALVPENGPIPNDLKLFANNLKEDISFQHSSEDLSDVVDDPFVPVELDDDAIISSLEHVVKTMETVIETNEADIAALEDTIKAKDSAIAEANATIDSKDSDIIQLKEVLIDKDAEISELNGKLVLATQPKPKAAPAKKIAPGNGGE